MSSAEAAVERDLREQAWLQDFAAAVATRDFDRGRKLFDSSVVAYGTRTVVMNGLEDLVEQQWTPIWMATTSFRFTSVDLVSRAGDMVVVGARWSSRAGDGRLRKGRCTLVLTGDPLLCTHSHFSMEPDGAGAGPQI